MVQSRVVESADGSRELVVGTIRADPQYLSALGVPILSGRSLEPADATRSPAPAVITASLARTLWPGQEALDRTLAFRGGGRGGSGRHHVVGIARDFVFGSLSRASSGHVVSLQPPYGGVDAQFVVRAASPTVLGDPIRAAVRALEPDVWRLDIQTGRELVARDLGRQRLGAWFFSGFGLTALVLGVGGVFGLVAYLAESRQREFGVRVALGAAPRDLISQGLSAALGPVSLGVSIGLLAASLLSHVFDSLLTGVSAVDVLSYATVAMTMLGCAGLAALAAAWRLRRVAPIEALRAQ
jgi:hypothetical protein